MPVGRLGEFVRGIEAIREPASVLVRQRPRRRRQPAPVDRLRPRRPRQPRAGVEAFDDVIRLGLSLGGTITGEHGIGSVKVPWLGLELGAAELARQRRLKAVFDPLGHHEPGQGLRCPRSHARFGA